MLQNTNNHLTDRNLVQAALGGDRRASGAIVKNTEGLVTQIIYKMVSQAQDRKDILQEVYMKVFKNLHSFKFGSQLSTWIASISYHVCVDYLKRKKLVLVEDYPEHSLMVSGEAEQRIKKSELSMILHLAIGKLSPLYGTLITLYHQEDFSYQQIAEVTGLPVGTVKNYLFRARAVLKQNLLNNYKREDL